MLAPAPVLSMELQHARPAVPLAVPTLGRWREGERGTAVMDGFEGKMVAPSLGETFQKETFEAWALQVPGGHFLIFRVMN